jgi:hypothetical protein
MITSFEFRPRSRVLELSVSTATRHLFPYSRNWGFAGRIIDLLARLVDFRFRIRSYRLRMTHKAWMMPGMYPKMVNTMFNQKWSPKPTSMNIPTGGQN